MSWRLGALLPLALLLACGKAEFKDDAGDGGSGGSGGADSQGGTGGLSGTGGGGEGGLDAGVDGDDATDSNQPSDLAGDSVDDSDVAADMGTPDTGPGSDADGSSGDEADAPTGVMPTQPGQILVSELLNDSSVVSDDFGEWFELYNPSADVTYSLLNCTISDIKNHMSTISKAVLMPPGSYRTFGLSMPGGVAGTDPGFTPDFVYVGIKFDNTAGDGVTIRCGGVIIDVFNYDPTMGLSGHSWSVDPVHLKPNENNVLGNFCKSNVPYHMGAGGATIDYGTPGQPNPPCPAGK